MIAAAILLARLEQAGLQLRVTPENRLGVTGPLAPETSAEIAANKDALLWLLKQRTRRHACLVQPSRPAELSSLIDHIRERDAPIGVALEEDATGRTAHLSFEAFVVSLPLPPVRTRPDPILTEVFAALGETTVLVYDAMRTLAPLTHDFGVRFRAVIDAQVACQMLESAMLDSQHYFTLSDIEFRELRYVTPSLSYTIALELQNLHRLWRHLERKLSHAELRDIAQIEFRMLSIALEMQAVGLRINEPAWRELVSITRERLEAARSRVQEKLSCDVNGREAIVALSRAGIVVTAINSESLAPYADVEIARDVLELCAASGLNSSVDLNMQAAMLRARGGRVRSHLAPLGARTGELRTWGPDVAQFARTQAARRCVTAEDGHALVVASFIDAKLRILADHVQDAGLLDLFARDGCPYVRTAALLFGKADAEVSDEEIRVGEIATEYAFGMTPEEFVVRATAVGLKFTLTQARNLHGEYLRKHPIVAEWLVEAAECRRLDVVGSMHRVDRFLQEATNLRERILAPFKATLMNAAKWSLADLEAGLSCAGARVLYCGLGEALLEVPIPEASSVRDQVELTLTSVLQSLVQTVRMRVRVDVQTSWVDDEKQSDLKD